MASQPVRLYLDEDVSVVVGEMLRARGYDVLSARDAGTLGKTDREQLRYASSESRTLITHNRVDFERLVNEQFDRDGSHSGVIILFRRSYAEMAKRLLPVLASTTPEAMIDQIRYV
jgi:hypothetical protein